ncbi:MAG: CdaR family protein [Clostridia bacterium]|jgi:YbbR domain-containing protein|nr:CdaR family protein [Clostridia bacterium]
MNRLKTMFTKDVGWKILSVLIALGLWFVVINTQNPVESRTFTSGIEIMGDNVITNAGKTILNEDAIKNTRVSFRVSGKRITLDRLQQSKLLNAYIDLSNIDVNSITSTLTLPVKIHSSVLSSESDIEYITPASVDVQIDDNISRAFTVQVNFSGDTSSDLVLNKSEISPDTVTVSGPKTYVDQVYEVKAEAVLKNPYNGQVLKITPIPYNAMGQQVMNVALSDNEIQVTLGVSQNKKVPINVKTSGYPAVGCTVEDVKIDPVSVNVTGDSDSIDNLLQIQLPDIDLSGKAATFTEKYDISKLLPSGVKLADGENGTVNVTIAISGETEHSMSISSDDIKLEGTVKEGCTAQVKPDTFNITIGGNRTDSDGLNENSISFYVNVDGLDEGEYKLPVYAQLPEGIRIIGGLPYADIVVTKQTNETPSSQENSDNTDNTNNTQNDTQTTQ